MPRLRQTYQDRYYPSLDWYDAQNYAWRTWSNNYTITQSSTAKSWYDWTWSNNTSAGTAAANYDVWNVWTTSGTVSGTAFNATFGASADGHLALPYRERRGAPAIIRTEDEWAVIAAENERRREERDKLQAVARAEARKLLEFVLTKQQLADYDATGVFELVGSHGTIYRLRHGISGNITQVVDGKDVSVLCIHPATYDHERRAHMPTEDSLVAQVLALKMDELEVVRKANVHRGRRHLAIAARDGEQVAA